MVYGDPSPIFRASVTVPLGEPLSPFYIAIDSQKYTGSISGTGPAYWMSVSGIGSPPLSVGQRSVVAQWSSQKYGLVASAPVTLNVLKMTPVLGCYVTNVLQTYAPGTQVTITTSRAA